MGGGLGIVDIKNGVKRGLEIQEQATEDEVRRRAEGWRELILSFGSLPYMNDTSCSLPCAPPCV